MERSAASLPLVSIYGRAPPHSPFSPLMSVDVVLYGLNPRVALNAARAAVALLVVDLLISIWGSVGLNVVGKRYARR